MSIAMRTAVPTFHNFNLKDIITPLNAQELNRLLMETKYDPEESEFLVKGFLEGFDIGYAGVVDRQDYSQNILLKVGTKEDLWGKIGEGGEVRKGGRPIQRNTIQIIHTIPNRFSA